MAMLRSISQPPKTYSRNECLLSTFIGENNLVMLNQNPPKLLVPFRPLRGLSSSAKGSAKGSNFVATGLKLPKDSPLCIPKLAKGSIIYYFYTTGSCCF